MNIISLSGHTYRYISQEKLFEQGVVGRDLPVNCQLSGNPLEISKLLKDTFPNAGSYDPWEEIDNKIDEHLSRKIRNVSETPVELSEEQKAMITHHCTTRPKLEVVGRKMVNILQKRNFTYTKNQLMRLVEKIG